MSAAVTDACITAWSEATDTPVTDEERKSTKVQLLASVWRDETEYKDDDGEENNQPPSNDSESDDVCQLPPIVKRPASSYAPGDEVPPIKQPPQGATATMALTMTTQEQIVLLSRLTNSMITMFRRCDRADTNPILSCGRVNEFQAHCMSSIA
jgi:hypothetical protein